MQNRICVVCNQEYTPKVGNQKVCSDECRKKYLKKMRPIWSKKYYNKNKDKRKRYNQEHAEEQRIYRKNYYQKNRDKLLANSRQWFQKNKEYRKEYCRKWNKDNAEHLKEYRRQKRENAINEIFAEYNKYLETLEE